MLIRYTTVRFVQALMTLFAITIVVFLMIHAAPGNPALQMVGFHYTEDAYDAIRKQMGLDDPLHVQYLRTVGGWLRGDLGMSMSKVRPNADLIAERLPVTAILSLASVLLSLLISIPLGTFMALRPGTAAAFIGKVIIYLGQSMPSFWTGLFFIILFAVQWRVFPVSGFGTWRQLVLPTATLALWLMGLTTRLVASEMEEQLRQMYVTVARAKGLKGRTVVFRHVFRNMLIPLVTLLGLQFGGLLGGAVAVEYVFAIPSTLVSSWFILAS